jgi:hypothetical protein
MTNRTDRTECIRPEEVQEMFSIKKVAYYNRLKFLEMQAHKDEKGKAYLDEKQLDILKELDEYISINGKMTGFSYSKQEANSELQEERKEEVSLITTEENGLTASTNGFNTVTPTRTNEPDIYVEPEQPVENSEVAVLIREAEELKARELAMRDLIKRKLADEMNEDDLSPDLQEKVNLAREAANPKFTPQEVAGSLLTQWRKNRLAS